MMEKISEWRRSKRLVLTVVTIALLLDSTLVSVIVPILPDYLNVVPSSNATTESSVKTFENSTACQDGNVTCTIKEPHQSKVAAQTHESTELGLLFASKAFVQVMVGPFVGTLTDRVGFSLPMFVGFIIMFLSTLTYAFADSYCLMFAARSVQGLASALTSIPGLAMLSHYYPNDKERGNAMAIAFGGVGLGVIIAPIFGGVFYKYFGKPAPFLIIAGLALIDGCLRLLVADPKVEDKVEKPEGPSLWTLFKDPYIMLSAGTLIIANSGIAFLEPALPVRMKHQMDADSVQQASVFLAISITFMLTSSLFARVGYWLGRHLTAMLGLILSGFCLIVIPRATTVTQLLLPNAGIGLSLAMVESSILPFLGHLVDIRHSAVYGNVFAIADTAFCLSFCIGPALSGFLVNNLGFDWSLWAVAAVCFMYAPLLYFLRNPPTKEEKKQKAVDSINAVKLEVVETYKQTPAV